MDEKLSIFSPLLRGEKMKLVKRENEMCKRQEQDTAPAVLATSLSIEIEKESD